MSPFDKERRKMSISSSIRPKLKKDSRKKRAMAKLKSKATSNPAKNAGKKRISYGTKKIGGNKALPRSSNAVCRSPVDEDTRYKRATTRKCKKVLTRNESRIHKMEQRGRYSYKGKAKGLWETLRRHDCSEDKRVETIKSLMLLTKGHIKELALKHDTARIVQTIFQYGSSLEKDYIFKEIREHVGDLCKLKYSKHLIKKVLKYGTPAQRTSVIKAFRGRVCQLLRHTEASDVVETAYSDHATAAERLALLLEFYGADLAHLKSQEFTSLKDLFEELPQKKQSVLKCIHRELVSLVNKPGFKHSMVHKVLWDYLKHADEQDRAEMIECVRERLVEILHTREGAHATLMCIWHGTPKDRKVIIKSFKGYVLKICAEEYGYLTLLAIFDTTDDTVLVKKAILSELLTHLDQLSTSVYGMRVLLYLLNPRSPKNFKKSFIAILAEGDVNNSKKDPKTRRMELLEAVSSKLVLFTEANVDLFVRDNHRCKLLIEVISMATDDVSGILEKILELVSMGFNEKHIVADPVGHFVIKQLIINESINVENGVQFKNNFTTMLIDAVDGNAMRKWASINRGAFVLICLCKSHVQDVGLRVAKRLKKMIPLLSDSKVQGQIILVKELRLHFKHTY